MTSISPRNTGDSVALVLLDLSAAFDTVDHSILISRLEHDVGLKGTVLQWFQSFLSGRTFRVKLGNSSSSIAHLTCGLPQGSILAPSLFSLYMLPLGTIIRRHGVSFHCYADDTQMYVPIKRNDPSALSLFLGCLDEVKSWLEQIFLFLNEDKTEIIVFGSSVNSQAASFDLGRLSAFKSSSVRNLGVSLDESLNFDKQISSVISSSFYQLRLLSKVKPFLNSKSLEMVVHAFITTRVDYCNSLYCGISKTQTAQLQLVQNAAARFLSNSRKSDHITPILRSLHWLPINLRIDFKIILFVYKSISNQAPSYLSELLQPYTPSRSLRSGDKNLLVVPHSRLKYRGDRAFSVAGPRLWNNLPIEVRIAPSVIAFKSLLKTHLFSLAYK